MYNMIFNDLNLNLSHPVYRLVDRPMMILTFLSTLLLDHWIASFYYQGMASILDQSMNLELALVVCTFGSRA